MRRGASGDLAKTIAGDTSQPDFVEKYIKTLDELLDANLASYRCAAQRDGRIAGVAPAGEAWRRAWANGLANPNPFQPSASSLSLLWYGINAVNDPPISRPDYHHPSVYGAYLSGLVLFVRMTGLMYASSERVIRWPLSLASPASLHRGYSKRLGGP
jgi:hypothetical protein